MKICMLDPLFFPYKGGSEKVVYEVSKRLVKRYKHEIVVLTSQLPNTKLREDIGGIDVVRLPSLYIEKLPPPFPPPYTITPSQTLAIMRQEADVFNINNRFAYFPLDILALKMKKTKLTLTLHNAKPQGISFLTDLGGAAFDYIWGRTTMQLCDRVTAVSEYTKKTTMPRSGWKKCDVIYNGTDTEIFKPRKDNTIKKKYGIEDKVMVLANSRLVPQKGIGYLIDAMKIVNEKHDTALVIIGHGSMKRQLEERCRTLGVQDSVIFAGAGLDDRQLSAYYNSADIFSLPSVWEPLGIALIEAMASGLPTVSSRTGGIPELIPNRDIGLLVEPKNGPELARNINLLIEDKRLREKLGRNARKHAEKNFSWDIVAGQYDRFYTGLVKK